MIPRRAQEGIHRIRFPDGRAAAFRAGRMEEFFTRFQRRRSTSREFDVFRQFYRQLFFRYELFATFFAVYDRNRGTPVALTGNQPVAEAEVYRRMAIVVIDEPFRNGFLPFFDGQAVEFTGIDEIAFACIGFGDVIVFVVDFAFRILDDIFDGNIVFLAEFKVTLIVAGNTHYGTGTIIDEDVVGNPDRYFCLIDRIDGIGTGKHANFFGIIGRTFNIALVAHFFNESAQFGFVGLAFDDPFHKGMFRSQDDEAGTEDRIDTGREQFYPFADFRDIKEEVCPFAAADPVALHGLDPFRPARQFVQIVEETVCIIGNLEEPLFQVFLDDRIVTAPAYAAFSLFVGKDGMAVFAPVDLGFLAVCQAAFVHQFEHPLRPFIIFFMAGGNFPVPVIGQAQGFLLPFHIGYIVIGPLCRRDIMLDSRIFCRHAECIESHGMNDVVADHSSIAGNDVADSVVADMAHMQIARRIREHFQYVVLGLVTFVRAFIYFIIQPDFLPFLFYFLWNIFFHSSTPHVANKIEGKVVDLSIIKGLTRQVNSCFANPCQKFSGSKPLRQKEAPASWYVWMRPIFSLSDFSSSNQMRSRPLGRRVSR